MKQILILLIIAFGFLPIQGEAKSCDTIFAESHFTDIDRKDYPKCVNRWTYLTNKIKRDYINNSYKYAK